MIKRFKLFMPESFVTFFCLFSFVLLLVGFYFFYSLPERSFPEKFSVYESNDGTIYKVFSVSDAYRAYSFNPGTTDEKPWNPVHNLPWKTEAEQAQADLDEYAQIHSLNKTGIFRFPGRF